MQMPGLIMRLYLLADGRTATGYLARQHLIVIGTLRPILNFKYPSAPRDVPQLRMVFLMLSMLNSCFKLVSAKYNRKIILVPNPNTAGPSVIAKEIYKQ